MNLAEIQKTHYDKLIVDMLKRPTPSFIVGESRGPTKLEADCCRLRYLIDTGYSIDAGLLAKDVATKIYDEQLDRRICEETGNVYFHACEDYY